MNLNIKRYLDFTYSLVSIMDLDELMEISLKKLRNLLNADAGSIFIYSEEDKRLIFKYTQNETIDIPFKEFSIPLDETSIAGYSGQRREIVRIDDVRNISGFPFDFNVNFDKMSGYLTKSVMAIPLANAKDELIGVLQLINKKVSDNISKITDFQSQIESFNKEDEEISHSLSGIIAVALNNSLLYKNIEDMWEGFIKASIQAMEARDPVTKGHTERVTKLSLSFAEALHNDTEQFRDFYLDKDKYKMFKYACLLHDFGKIGVRESVLNKTSKLYPYQIEVIKWRIETAKYLLPEMKSNLDACLNCVLLANEPTVTESGAFDELKKCNEIKFELPSFGDVKIISDDEYESLSVTKGSLTDGEREEIQSHVQHTYNYLTKIPWTKKLKDIPRIACMHHEREDGSGYPFGLKSPDIHILGKIMSIADIYDALTAKDRPYKKALPIEKALSILKNEAEDGKLDKKLVDFFVQKEIYSCFQEE